MDLETGILDNHKIIMAIFRSTFARGKPKTFIAVIKRLIQNSFKWSSKKN